MKRRQFLGCVTAAASSYVLVACGGGGGSDLTASSSAGTSAVANASSAAASSASPDNTTVPPAASIVDNSANVWTLKSGYIYVNGSKMSGPYNVATLLWYGGYVYQINTSNDFYQYTGTKWVKTIDPRLGGTSADGTAVPPASYIIDKLNNIWTLSGGYALKNNVKDTASSSVTLLVWYGGMLYQQRSGGQFYVKTWMNTWAPCNDPRANLVSSSGHFYGINGHYDYPFTATQVVTALQALGCTTYRVGCVNKSTQLNPVISLARAFQSANMTLFTLVNYGLRDTTGTLYTSESAAYSASYTGAAAIATALAPYGVTMYECGNELTRDPAIIVNSTYAGTKNSDFNNVNWPIMRGAIRGMIDGIKSVQPSAKVGVNFCVADVAASDMLWDGVQPDGTTGHQTVRWDITTWHNYSPYGDVFNIGTDGAGPGFNLPSYCKARYGVPFFMTEWNAAPEKDETTRAAYVTQQMTEFYAARKTQGVESVMYYELTSGDYTYGIVLDDLTPIQPTYNAFQSFVNNNPDN
jgi:hypothetical protein